MQYISTRGEGSPKRFSEILLEGLASDGGLYVPEEYPFLTDAELSEMRSISYLDLAEKILSKFTDDIPPEDLRKIVRATYTKEIFGSA